MLEEKSRSLEGLIEEISYVRRQIEKLMTQNSLLEEKIDLINNKKLSTIDNKNEIEGLQDDLVEEYPIYPGMANKKNSKEKDELNIMNDSKNNNTVEVLAKIDPNSGKGEIIKETDLAYLRPCTDECLPPNKKNLVIGKKISTNVVEGDPINLNNVE